MNPYAALGLGLVIIAVLALAWRDAVRADEEDDARELARRQLHDRKDRSP